MKTYLLLRNNRQSGPFTLSQILQEGLRPHDLVWVEGQSASWRYPSELDELKAHVPPPVLEAPLDLGFSEVQKRVVQHRTGQATAIELPLKRKVAAPDLARTSIPHSSIPALQATAPVSDMSVPAFDALAGLLPEDDLMPTMAWQAHTDVLSAEAPAGARNTPNIDMPPSAQSHQAAAGDLPKIKVLLPAAMADKTMVVIRRRDMSGQPVTQNRARSRRPVLEFIPEEVDADAGNITLPSLASTIAGSPLLLPAEEAASPVPAVALSEMPAAETVEPVTGLELNMPVKEAETATAVMAETAASTAYQSRLTEDLPGADDSTLADTESLTPLQAAPTLQVNISLMQKIAVVTAIVSLIAVTILIANSIFNPNAYQFGTKPPSTETKQASPAAAKGTVKP